MRSLARLLCVLIITCVVVGCGDDDKKDTPLQPEPDDSATTSVTRGSSGVLEHDDGAKLYISPGTVGMTPEGEPGEMVFSIEKTQVAATVPANYEIEGDAWQFGPEGINFGQRVRISIPVPDTSKAYVLGRLNRSTNTWEIVPTLESEDDPGRLFADAKHLSAWSLFSYDRLNPKAAGRVHFWNDDSRRWLSVCVQSYTLAYPEWNSNFNPSSVGTSLSNSGHIPGVTSDANAIVPQGTWTFQVTRTEPISQFGVSNADGWITLDPITVNMPGEHGPHVHLNPSGWTEVKMEPRWAPCEGVEDVVFGTGDVQITATWPDPVDIDLHVFEPNGERIYFGNDTSETGGRLDRDTICESTTQGRPENIYWATSAPRGRYEVRVHLYSLCSTTLTNVPYAVRTIVDGRSKTYYGSLIDQQEKIVAVINR